MNTVDKLEGKYKKEYSRMEAYIGSIAGVSIRKRVELYDWLKADFLEMQEGGAAITEENKASRIAEIKERCHLSGRKHIITVVRGLLFKFLMVTCAIGFMHLALKRKAIINGVTILGTSLGFCIFDYISNKQVVKRIESGRKLMDGGLRLLFSILGYALLGGAVALLAETYFDIVELNSYRIAALGGIMIYSSFLYLIWSTIKGQDTASVREENGLGKTPEILLRRYHKKRQKEEKRGNQLGIGQYIEKKQKSNQLCQCLLGISSALLIIEEVVLGAFLLVFEESDTVLVMVYVLAGIGILLMETLRQAGKVRQEILLTLREFEREAADLERK